MDDLVVARLLHVIGVVLWIGGVAMVTTVILPEARRRPDPADRLGQFDALEHRFMLQARGTTLLTGATGFYMIYRLELWERFAMAEFWWMHAMVGVWLIFTTLLFVFEPWFLNRWFRRYALTAPDRAFATAIQLHRTLLLASLITIAGAVAGSHGVALF